MIMRYDFVTRFGGVFEHSPFIAERAVDAGIIKEPLTAVGIHSVMVSIFRAATVAEKLAVLRAHPDLAGKLAIAGKLTVESRQEQAGVGLDRLNPQEHARFSELNKAYVSKFGFPFIIAVKGLDKEDILDAFETRINHDRDAEFATATAQVEKIALLRLKTMLPET
ncbi:MAG: 2-oxo-4-hydroxy-4-carboxy-5-ureidoimidazoline decarboxylase [Rhizobium sp.]